MNEINTAQMVTTRQKIQTIYDYPGLFYHKVTSPADMQKMEVLRVAAHAFAENILHNAPQNRYRSLAMTCLEDALMRAIQALVIECGEMQAPNS